MAHHFTCQHNTK